MPRYWIMLATLMMACGCKSGQWPWSTNNPANRIPPPATGTIGRPAGAAPAGSPYYTPPAGTGAATPGWQPSPPASAGYAPPATSPYTPPAGVAPLSPMPPTGAAPYNPPAGQFSPPGGYTTPSASFSSPSLNPDALAASDNGWVASGTRRAGGADAFRDVTGTSPGTVTPAAAWGTGGNANVAPIVFASAPAEGTARLEAPVRIVETNTRGFTPALNGMPVSDASQVSLASHAAPIAPLAAPHAPPAYTPPAAAPIAAPLASPPIASPPNNVAPTLMASNVPVGTGVSPGAVAHNAANPYGAATPASYSAPSAAPTTHSNSYSPLSDFQPARDAATPAYAPATLASIPATAPGSVWGTGQAAAGQPHSVQPAGVLMQPAPNAFPGNVPTSYVPPNPQPGMTQPGVPQPFVPRGTAYPLTPAAPAVGVPLSSTTGPYVPPHSSWAGGQPVRGFARPGENNVGSVVPASTPVIFASTPTPAAPAIARSQQVQYAYQPDYEALRGRLEYSHTIQKWKLRYISPDAAESQIDELGGYVVFEDVPQLGGFRTGDFVAVEGSLDDKTGDLGKYLLRTIRRLE